MEYVYKLYFPMIAHFVRNNSGNENDAEDIYQEGLLIVFQKIRNGEHIQYLKSFIYSVCRLKWMEKLRYRKRHAEKLVENHEFIAVDIYSEEQEATPYQDTLQQAINELDEICKQLLLSFYFEKLSMEEIAARFGYNQANTAKSKKNKCMDRIRERAKKILQSFQQ
jgi:RNA polymerase sigma factor (sigma-70 family)